MSKLWIQLYKRQTWWITKIGNATGYGVMDENCVITERNEGASPPRGGRVAVYICTAPGPPRGGFPGASQIPAWECATALVLFFSMSPTSVCGLGLGQFCAIEQTRFPGLCYLGLLYL